MQFITLDKIDLRQNNTSKLCKFILTIIHQTYRQNPSSRVIRKTMNGRIIRTHKNHIFQKF